MFLTANYVIPKKNHYIYKLYKLSQRFLPQSEFNVEQQTTAIHN